MPKIIISLGGSVYNPNKFRYKYLEKLFSLLSEYNNQYIIVCGGGASARNKINDAKKQGLSNKEQDLKGIEAINENIIKIGDIFYKYFPKLKITEKYSEVKGKYNFIVGAEKPGRSSDWNAVKIAENLNVDLILNLSNTDQIYTKDPSKYKTAKPLKNISWNYYLREICKKEIPGGHYPFDPIASKLAKSKKIKVYFVNGNKLNRIKKFFEKQEYGSLIE